MTDIFTYNVHTCNSGYTFEIRKDPESQEILSIVIDASSQAFGSQITTSSSESLNPLTTKDLERIGLFFLNTAKTLNDQQKIEGWSFNDSDVLSNK